MAGIALSLSAIAQQPLGSLQGKITDQETGEPLMFANVALQQGETQVGGAQTDMQGRYEITQLKPGTYSVTFSYIGYAAKEVKEVLIDAGKATSLDVQLQGGVQLDEIVVIEYSRPLIEMDNTSTGHTLTREEIRSLPTRVQSKGARNKDLESYIDGIRIHGLPPREGVPEREPLPQLELSREGYAPLVENPFQSPMDHPLSTFSIDVDNASYTNTRRMLNYGQLPPVDAVRIEEFINYFDYSYPNPQGEHPFSINTELSECPWNQEHYLLHIGLQGQRIETANLPPSNLVFLIDVSGSMQSPNKLPLVQESLKLLATNLRPQDRVAMVVYAGAAGLVLPSTPGSEKATILQAIDRLRAGGSTAGGAGLKLAFQVAQENFAEGGNNRIVLATDGDFNVGPSSDAEMQCLIEEKRETGVYLTVLGFGMGNYQDSKMEILADKGNGNYAYIDHLREAQKVLVNEMGGTLVALAKDVKLQLEFNPAFVEGYRLIGYENRLLNAEDFNDDLKDAGELGAGHSVTALYEVIPAGKAADIPTVDPLKYFKQKVRKDASTTGELLTVKFRYKLPSESKSKLLVRTVRAQPQAWEQTSENYRFSAAVAAFGLLLRQSESKGSTNYDLVLELARASKGEDLHGYRADFLQQVELAQSLDKRVSKR